MKILLSIALCFMFSLAGFGQAKKPTLKTPPKLTRAIVETEAVTKDGKAVVLRSDGTWRFSASTPITQTKASSTINIEAAIIYRADDVVPVAQTKFYLLPDSVGTILKAPLLTEILVSDSVKQSTYLPDEFRAGKLSSYISALRYETIYPNFVLAAYSAISKNAKFETTSDLTGKASFSNVPQGRYYLFVISQTKKGFTVWDLEVNVNAEVMNVILDKNNALAAF